MGKNKGQKPKGKKDHNVFKVAGIRKPKTKAVNTNLKKLNVHTKNKTDEANQKFKALQSSMVEAAVDSSKAIKKKQVTKQISQDIFKQQPDVNMAAEEFSKL